MTTPIAVFKTDVPADSKSCASSAGHFIDAAPTCSTSFNQPGTCNGPTEAINGLIEHLRGTARGFRNLGNYIARCLLDAGGFRPLIHSVL